MKYIISKEDFKQLAQTHAQHCVSIYIPTTRAGEEVDQKHGQKVLKNNLKTVKKELADYNMSVSEIDSFLEPVEDLLEDQDFWRHQSDCLAIFVNENTVQHFTLPIRHDNFTYVSDHFYLLLLCVQLTGWNNF